MTATSQSRNTYSLEQAVGAAPTLAALQERIRASRSCLDQVRHLIPESLQRQIQAALTVRSRLHDIAFFFQAPLDKAGNLTLVFNHKDSHDAKIRLTVSSWS